MWQLLIYLPLFLTTCLADEFATINTTLECCPESMLLTKSRVGCQNTNSPKTATIAINCPEKNLTIPLKNRHNGTHLVLAPGEVFNGTYCLGKINRSDAIMDVAVVCFEPEEPTTGIPAAVTIALAAISVPCLLATALTYTVVEEIRDLQGKSIIALCVAMSIGQTAIVFHRYLSMTLVQCAFMTFLSQFFLLAAFFWMNAISIQVCRVIFLNFSTSDREFRWYSIYAWGGAAVILVITLAVNFIPNRYSPGIGLNYCWFTGNSKWFLMNGPIGVLVAINIILYVVSAVKFCFLNESPPSARNNILRFRISLFFKMAIIMGISWLADIGSTIHNKYHIFWDLMDVYNMLQGALLFLVLVLLRKKAISGLANRYYLCCLSRTIREYLVKRSDAEDEYQSVTEAVTVAVPIEFEKIADK